tara:strand:- start:176 stop:739 length:564 start_codon:yes stop_codon:yes gene_type:complete
VAQEILDKKGKPEIPEIMGKAVPGQVEVMDNGDFPEAEAAEAAEAEVVTLVPKNPDQMQEIKKEILELKDRQIQLFQLLHLITLSIIFNRAGLVAVMAVLAAAEVKLIQVLIKDLSVLPVVGEHLAVLDLNQYHLYLLLKLNLDKELRMEIRAIKELLLQHLQSLLQVVQVVQVDKVLMVLPGKMDN